MLIQLLVAVIVAGLVWWLLTMLPIPEPFKKIVLVVFIIICVVWLLNFAGLFTGPYSWGGRGRLP